MRRTSPAADKNVYRKLTWADKVIIGTIEEIEAAKRPASGSERFGMMLVRLVSVEREMADDKSIISHRKRFHQKHKIFIVN
jgi:hypothetical protein